MKKIAIISRENCNWIGGLYYKKNIIYQLLCNNQIALNYEIYLFVYKENYDIFQPFENKIVIQFLSCYKKPFSYIEDVYFCKKNKIDFLFPCNRNLSLFGIQSIAWIPDFQHIHYPDFFSQDELTGRKRTHKKLANNNVPVVLSSNDSKKDFLSLCKKDKDIAVMPFVSYILPDLKAIYETIEVEFLNQLGLKKHQFICVCNQFWQHKNHLVVLEAIKELSSIRDNMDIKFVFTGKMEDYRNPEYIKKLKNIANMEQVKDKLIFTGFLERKNQIILMKNARFIIQPSLFEGWGTVVEDAKVLDKSVLLSDIPIHHEQMNSKCILFNPLNSHELAEKIVELYQFEQAENINDGLNDMKNRAVRYTENFQVLLEKYCK